MALRIKGFRVCIWSLIRQFSKSLTPYRVPLLRDRSNLSEKNHEQNRHVKTVAKVFRAHRANGGSASRACPVTGRRGGKTLRCALSGGWLAVHTGRRAGQVRVRYRRVLCRDLPR